MSTDFFEERDEDWIIRRARIQRNLELMRESIDRKKEVIARWRREGILPPEEPRRGF